LPLCALTQGELLKSVASSFAALRRSVWARPYLAERNNVMGSIPSPVAMETAEEHLMRFLAVEGLPGKEKAIGESVIAELRRVGVPASAIRFDKANERIPAPTQTGSLFVDLPGTCKGPRLLSIAHLDRVPLCAGAKPNRAGDRIVSDGTTALGGDNRAGRTSVRSGFGFARGGRLHQGEQECNAEVGRYLRGRWLFRNATSCLRIRNCLRRTTKFGLIAARARLRFLLYSSPDGSYIPGTRMPFRRR
jgi:hypothetical protein